MPFYKSPHFKFVAILVIVLGLEILYLVKDRFGNFNPVESTPLTFEQQADMKYRKWLESERNKTKKYIDPVKFGLEQSYIEGGQVWMYYIDSTLEHGIHDFPHHPDLKLNLYGALYAVYLPEEICKALSLAQKNLQKEYPFYHLKVLDGTRAVHVDSALTDTLRKICGLKSLTSTPPNPHHFGSAVDVIMVNEEGIVQDMGSEYNIFTEIGLKDPGQMPDTIGMTKRQEANRELLKKVMISAGFRPSPDNNWHFEYFNSASAGKFSRIR